MYCIVHVYYHYLCDNQIINTSSYITETKHNALTYKLINLSVTVPYTVDVSLMYIRLNSSLCVHYTVDIATILTLVLSGIPL